jgi:acyl carrier protein
VNTEIPLAFLETLKVHLPYAERDELTASDDLAALGLDSMGVVQLLVDLEDRFNVELSDEVLDESTFTTVGSLWAAVSEFFAPVSSGHE